MDFVSTRVVEITRPAPDYAYLRFAGDRPILGDPGQFAMVRGDFGTDPILPRAFSLVETGEHGAILVKVIGKGTRRLASLQVADTLKVLGPLGNTFDLPKGSRRPVLVAGGVGVAPLLYLAETLGASGVKPVFVYGGRTAGDILFRERIASVSRLIVTTEDGSLGEKGRVTPALERVLADGEDFAVYACGPEPMMAALFGITRRAGVPLQVSLEQAMACGMGTCKGCAVHDGKGEFCYVCSDGPVFDAETIFGGGA
jgi:dihydroorotate dehydrogenase electron transfer subunit